jgi:hypothetical protein
MQTERSTVCRKQPAAHACTCRSRLRYNLSEPRFPDRTPHGTLRQSPTP